MKQNPDDKNLNFLKSKTDVLIIIACSVLFYVIAIKHDILEKINAFAARHETFELDELVSLSIFLAICLALYSVRRRRDIQKAKTLLERQNTQLEKTVLDLQNEIGAHQASLKKIRSIYDAAPVGIGVAANDMFRDVNEYFCQLTGYSKNELIGQHVEMIHGDEEYFDVDGILETVKNRGSAVHEAKYKRKNGELIDFRIGFAPLNPANPSEGITFIVLDVTELKQLEAALIENEAKYRRFFENDITGDFLMKTDGTLLDCNPALARMLGFESNDEIMEKNAAAVYPPDKTKNILDRLCREKRIEGIRLELTLPDKRPLYCIGNLMGHFDTAGNMTHFIGYLFDDTKRVLMEKELRTAHKMEAMGTLAGGIAHDFNNLLQPILGYTTFLIDDLPENSPQREYAEKIITAGMRAKNLVQQILSFSRKSPHETIAVRVQNILKEVVSLCRSTIPSNIDIHFDFQKGCSAVKANPTQLHQVAMNLIVNAYHAIDQAAGKISVQVKEIELNEDAPEVSSLKPGRFVLLSVSDTGCGMDNDTVRRIFDPYFTTKTQGKGTGLGLAVVYGIVKDYHGDINIRSEVGKGTTMNVYLPVPEDLVEGTEARRKPDIYQGGRERVLLVDDEKVVLELADDMLKRLGYQVTPFQNSTKALEAFTAAPEAFDLIISDMTMPEMTGDRLAEKALVVSPDIPIIICTGSSERISAKRAKDIGIKKVLMKPFSISEVSRKIREVLDD